MKLTRLIALFTFVAVAITAQAPPPPPHSATLTWTDPSNPSGTTYNVHRADGLCQGTPPFAVIASGVAALTYKDTTVTTGNYCYTVTAVVNGVESAQSNWALAPVPASPPTGLGVVVQ